MFMVIVLKLLFRDWTKGFTITIRSLIIYFAIHVVVGTVEYAFYFN